MNKVVHFEIPTDDVKRAKGFYGAVFGWNIHSIPGIGYAAYFKDSEGNVLGLWENK